MIFYNESLIFKKSKLKMRRPLKFKTQKCSAISNFEWHPFTLTSAPEEDFLSVHVRSSGDWTGELHKLLNGVTDLKDAPSIGKVTFTSFENEKKSKITKKAVDGPYGASSQDVFLYDVSVCIGAGIGVTPFASLLRSGLFF